MNNKIITEALRKAIFEISNAAMFSTKEFLKGEGFSNKEISKLLENDLDNEDINILRNALVEIGDAAMMNPREFLLGESYSEEEINEILGE